MRSRFSGAGARQFGFHGNASEAAIVVGQEKAQNRVGRVEIAGAGQTEFAGEAILEAPEAFDPSFGLRAAGRDEGDAELLQGAAELRGWRLPASCSWTDQKSSLRTKRPLWSP